jgi:hypothetical protein
MSAIIIGKRLLHIFILVLQNVCGRNVTYKYSAIVGIVLLGVHSTFSSYKKRLNEHFLRQSKEF